MANSSGIEVIREKYNKRNVWYFYYPSADDKLRTSKKMALKAIEDYKMTLQAENDYASFYA